MKKTLLYLVFLSVLAGCATYYDPFDDYVRGLRLFDRGAFEQAKNHWEPLANAEDCDAQFRLGTLYFLGSGVSQNDATARHWLFSAANQGHGLAQILLAVTYAHDTTSIGTVARTVAFDCTVGCGAEKNMVEAYKWANISENFGVYDNHKAMSKALVKKYSQSMTQEQIAEAKQRAQDWKPTPNLCKQRYML